MILLSFLTFGGYLWCVGISRMSEQKKGGGWIFILGMMACLSFLPLGVSISSLVEYLNKYQNPYYIEHGISMQGFIIPGVIGIAMMLPGICCFIKLLKEPRKLNKQVVKFILSIIVVTMVASVIGLALDADSHKSDRGKCTICGEKATNTFQNSEYCAEHYEKAVKWAIDDVADKDD